MTLLTFITDLKMCYKHMKIKILNIFYYSMNKNIVFY